MNTVLAAFLLLFPVVVHGQNPPTPSTSEAEKKLADVTKTCKQSTIDMIHVWSEQLVEDVRVVEKLSYEELDDTERTITGCLLAIDESEARRNPKGTREETNPRVLAYEVDGNMLMYAYEQEQKLRLLSFIEAKGLKTAFLASSNGTPN